MLNNMQPQYQTAYGRQSRKRLLIVITVFVLVVAGATVFLIIMKKHNAAQPLFTPPKTTTPQSQTTKYGNTNGPTFSYPQGWKDVSVPGSQTITLAYIVNGVTYRMRISPPGQINPEGANITDTITTVTYNGRPYTRAVWSANGQRFYVTAIPAQSQSGNVYVLSMDLPPTDTDRYLATFDAIANTLSY